MSVSCSAFARNGIVEKLSQDIRCTFYTDDWMIFARVRNEAHSSEVIQSSVNKLAERTQPKDMKFSSEKSGSDIYKAFKR